ncbi:hypothetical protein GYH30_027722 [Glycine max]|uniref:BED-type domain-containing protein n=1 Tax=Glycine max TaxID=3847 RepID=K7LIV3_SOYBN|nr:hypothetical protein GYH30_027722 [Glycine max]
MSSNFLVSNTEVTTSPAITGSIIARPPHHNGRRNRSEAWNHFNQLEPTSDKRAQCKYCDVVINYENGTSSMLDHFNQDLCEMEMVKLFIEVELPFRLVEHPAFRRYSYTLQPKFNIWPRYTLSRKIVILWNTMNEKLKYFLLQHCRRVCLTTNAWTSPQNVSYMCLTTHFIDNNWKLHKKILGFRQKGYHIHMCCCACILNLIVNSRINEIDNFVLRIRAAMKYIRSSPSRLISLIECAERKNIDYKGHICLDVETRWNSTYLVLDATLKHRKAFSEFEFHDRKYANDMGLTIFLTTTFTHKMAKNMKEKYQKYCGDPNKLNILLLIVVVLAPRSKVKYINWAIDQLFDVDKAHGSKSRLKSSLKSLLNENNARELFAMPVSTVASESAFSTGGRMHDPFRSSLSHEKVETFICTQD